MKGKTCIVTGATSGIGREVAQLLAAQGARVIGIGRDWNRCTEACTAIARATGNDEVAYEIADLSSLTEIRALAGRLRTRYGRIDVLVNNAGTFTLTRKETTDGLETQLAVNWLAGFLLTGLLLPCLLAAPGARTVTVSSGSHYAGRIHWDDLQLRHGYHGLKAYDQSKLATVLFMAELARRTNGRISTYAVDPGLVKTEIGMKRTGPLVRLVWKLRMRNGIPARQAAESVAYCAAAPEAEGKSGLYWKERQPIPPSPLACNREDATRLWSMGEKLCGLRY